MAQGSTAGFGNLAAVTRTGFRKYSRFGEWKIGARLTACFVAIVLLMIVGDAIAVLQFDRVETPARRFYEADQKSLAIVRVQVDVVTFRETLADVARDQNLREFVSQATLLRDNFLTDATRAQQTLISAPDVNQDPTILIRLETVRAALPSQVDVMLELAKAGDWQAVLFRLAGQAQPLIGLSSSLVADVDREVAQERAQALDSTQQARRQLYMALPLTALLILFIAASLGWYATRRISKPLAQLDDGAQALARGEFDFVVEVRGNDELADLARAFNYAARQLHKLYDVIKRNEAYLTEAQRLSHTGSFGWNVSRGELSWSEETCRIFECDKETKPTVEFVIQRTHPDDRPFLQQVLDRATKEKKDFSCEHRLLLPRGSVKHLQVVARALENDPAQLEFVGAVMDITAHKRGEEALRQAQADLEHISRVTTMGELTASLAHEIRQPITAAVTNANTCLRWLASDRPNLEEARAAASRIVNDMRRTEAVIGRIRTLFRKGAPQPELVDANEVIREIIALLRGTTTQYSISIRTKLAEDLPSVMVDRVQLQQVFMNLILNGVEAMKDLTPPGQLTVESQAEGRELLFSVIDTGVGLPREHADQVFNAFFTTKPDGTGMGLPISRSIIESHGGRLWADANSGPGTTFHFTLPVGVEVSE